MEGPRKTHPIDVLKALAEVRLHSGRVAGLGQDFQQLVVREEVEPGEGRPLGLQVFAQAFLHLLQQLVALPEVPQQAAVGAMLDDLHSVIKPEC